MSELNWYNVDSPPPMMSVIPAEDGAASNVGAAARMGVGRGASQAALGSAHVLVQPSVADMDGAITEAREEQPEERRVCRSTFVFV